MSKKTALKEIAEFMFYNGINPVEKEADAFVRVMNAGIFAHSWIMSDVKEWECIIDEYRMIENENSNR